MLRQDGVARSVEKRKVYERDTNGVDEDRRPSKALDLAVFALVIAIHGVVSTKPRHAIVKVFAREGLEGERSGHREGKETDQEICWYRRKDTCSQPLHCGGPTRHAGTKCGESKAGGDD